MKYLAGIDKESVENMEMIIGGAYQGKTVYAKKEYPLLNWADGDKVTEEELMRAQGVTDFQKYIRRELEKERDVSELAEQIILKNRMLFLSLRKWDME